MPRLTGYTNPLNLDPQKTFFFIFQEHSIQSFPDMYTMTEFIDPMVPTREEIACEMDILPEKTSLPGTAIQLSQNTYRLTTLIKLLKQTQEKICAIEESIKGQAKKVLWHEKVLLQHQMLKLSLLV